MVQKVQLWLKIAQKWSKKKKVKKVQEGQKMLMKWLEK